jgi:putative ABC transport system ATP-binding protein
MALLELRDVRKVYDLGEIQVEALRGVGFEVERGEFVAIMGASGSGKSTLMHILGCLDVPTSGEYRLDGNDIGRLPEARFPEIRNRFIGFVFQGFNLLARTSALENVELPLLYRGVPRAERHRRARGALERVGLGDRLHHQPHQLSGGQQQRVAIARAVVGDAPLLLADEPTGNLDSRASEEIMGLFSDLNERAGVTVVFVTHEPDMARYAKRIIHVRDGLIRSDGPPEDPVRPGGKEARDR